MKFQARLLFVLSCLIMPCLSYAYTAIAFVNKHAPDTNFVVWDYGSQREADQAALKGCLKTALQNGVPKQAGKCAVMHRQKGAGFGAIACGKNDCAWATGYDRKQEAVDAAYQNCSEGDSCPDTGLLAWEDTAGYPKPKQQALQKVMACSPPAGKVVSSRTACTNGACTRTFDNGCQVQFNAPYCFDPMQGKWDWKPDGC